MTNDVTRQPQDLFAKYAAGTATSNGPWLKFVKGNYLIDKEPIALGTEFIALMNDVAQVWVRFEDGKPDALS